MSDKLFQITSAIISAAMLIYSFVNSLTQVNCLANPTSKCPMYRSDLIAINPNILDELILFTSFTICLIAFVNLAQFFKSKAISSLLIATQIGLIIFQKTFIKTIIPF